MGDNVNELVWTATVKKMVDLSKERKLMIKENSKPIDNESTFSNLAIQSVTRNESTWTCNGHLMLNIPQQGAVISIEAHYSFSCEASIKFELDYKQDKQVKTIEIVDNTIFVQKR